MRWRLSNQFFLTRLCFSSTMIDLTSLNLCFRFRCCSCQCSGGLNASWDLGLSFPFPLRALWTRTCRWFLHKDSHFCGYCARPIGTLRNVYGFKAEDFVLGGNCLETSSLGHSIPLDPAGHLCREFSFWRLRQLFSASKYFSTWLWIVFLLHSCMYLVY